MSSDDDDTTESPEEFYGEFWQHWIILGRKPGDDVGQVKFGIDSRPYGMYVVGVTGAGKSTFLLNLICQDMWGKRGCFVLDPNGDLINDIIARSWFRREDIVLLDLQDPDVSFGLNPFACADPSDPVAVSRMAARVVDVFKKVWGDMSWGPRMEDLLANAALTLVASPGATLADLPPLLTQPAVRKKFVARLRNPVVRDYWLHEYDQMKPGMQQQVYGPVMNKVRKFLRDPRMSAIVSQPENTVDFRQAIDERKIVLVRLDSDQEEATNLLGAIILQQLLEATFSRRDLSVRERFPFMVYVDECHRFATSTFVTLLREGRKYGVATTAATQMHALLPKDVATAFLNVAAIACFQLIPEDARVLAQVFTGEAFPVARQLVADPFAYLIRNGHPKYEMVDATQNLIEKLANYQAFHDRIDRVYYQSYEKTPSTALMRQIGALIDQLLVRANRGTLKGNQEIFDRLTTQISKGMATHRDNIPYWEDNAFAKELVVAFLRLSTLLRKNPLYQPDTKGQSMAERLSTLPFHHILFRYRGEPKANEHYLEVFPPMEAWGTIQIRPSRLSRPVADQAFDIELEAPLYFEDEPDDDAPPTEAWR